jgi:hypothetical protein
VFISSIIQHGLTSETIFEEIPISIHNTNLVNALMYQLEDENVLGLESEFSLEAPLNDYLERTLNLMIDNLDNFASEQAKAHQAYKNLMKQQQLHQRRQQENVQKVSSNLSSESIDTSYPILKSDYNLLQSMVTASQAHGYLRITSDYAQKLYKEYATTEELSSHTPQSERSHDFRIE